MLAQLPFAGSALARLGTKAAMYEQLSSKPVYSEATSDPSSSQPVPLFNLWEASRPTVSDRNATGYSEKPYSQPGSHRKYTLENLYYAFRILQETLGEMLLMLWSLSPLRMSLLLCLTIIRGLFPAFRGYSQALILDEVRRILIYIYIISNSGGCSKNHRNQIQKQISAGDLLSTRLMQLILREGLRMLAESLFDAIT